MTERTVRDPFHEAAARIEALEASHDALVVENEKLRKAASQAADIIKRNLYHQHEKVEDAETILRAALMIENHA